MGFFSAAPFPNKREGGVPGAGRCLRSSLTFVRAYITGFTLRTTNAALVGDKGLGIVPGVYGRPASLAGCVSPLVPQLFCEGPSRGIEAKQVSGDWCKAAISGLLYQVMSEGS